MEKFVASLKKKYKERLLNCAKQWPPVSVEKLVNLELVETEKKEGFRAGLPQHGAHNDKVKRTPILHGNLFKVEKGKKPIRKLIVEGNAGMGKTSLCTMLTEEWASGKIFTQFDCVLLLPLRERSVSTATTLSQLFKLFHSSERIRTSVMEELEEREGEGVLIIADGWDELDQENRSDSSFLYTFLFGNIFPFLSILLTSRPFASADLHDLPTVDRLVEVVGFNEENIQQFIESEFEECPEKASSLIEQLENNPVIQSVCSVPLNCAIICYLWHTFESGLPTTLTELYTHIVLNVILRNIKKTNPAASLRALESFDNIPTANQEMFWLTCAFAYNCLSEDQLVFTESKVASTLPQVLDSSEKFLCLGLLQYARSLLPVGQGLSFHFVHLTIQEFLAALHLVTLPNEEKLKVWEVYARSDRFAMVWRFMFGLGCNNKSKCSKEVVYLEDEVVDKIFSKNQAHRLELCHYSMESLNDVLSSKAANQINGYFKWFSVFTAYDCLAIFHVLRQTSYCSCVKFESYPFSLTIELLEELADILSSAGINLQVEELHITSSVLTDKAITDFLSKASTSLFFLKSLSFSFIRCRNGIIDILPLMSSFDCLTKLCVSNSPLGASGIQSLETAVLAGTFISLESLHLSDTLTDDAGTNGALLATLLPSIASHCPHLRDLNLSENNLGVPGASAVGELIVNNQNELQLDLSDTNIDTKAVSALFSLTPSEPCCVCHLSLSGNPIGYDGLLTIIRMIRSKACPLLIYLDLGNTNLTTSVNTLSNYQDVLLPTTNSVFNLGPPFENRLTNLFLFENNFSKDKVFVLAECMQFCTWLTLLSCWSCSLSSTEVIVLLDHLQSCGGSLKLLRSWELHYNTIDDDGVNAIIENLPVLFPVLKKVNLSNNPVRNKVKKRLEEMLLPLVSI